MKRVVGIVVAGLVLALAWPPDAAAAELGVLAGVDTKTLDGAQRETLENLLNKYPSVCGKAHSLLTSLRTDPSCKRSPFAARYLVMLIRLGLAADEVGEHYEARFVSPHHGSCHPGGALRGSPTAPIHICSFSDFQCPHCKHAEPLLRDVVKNYSQVQWMFKNYPLTSIHANARDAAAAAVAAGWQGQFWAMADALFEHQDHLDPTDVEKIARSLKLDLAKWKNDLNQARSKVDEERREGEALHIDHTPTIFINGREYVGPLLYDNLKDWIDEELAR